MIIKDREVIVNELLTNINTCKQTITSLQQNRDENNPTISIELLNKEASFLDKLISSYTKLHKAGLDEIKIEVIVKNLLHNPQAISELLGENNKNNE